MHLFVCLLQSRNTNKYYGQQIINSKQKYFFKQAKRQTVHVDNRKLVVLTNFDIFDIIPS